MYWGEGDSITCCLYLPEHFFLFWSIRFLLNLKVPLAGCLQKQWSFIDTFHKSEVGESRGINTSTLEIVPCGIAQMLGNTLTEGSTRKTFSAFGEYPHETVRMAWSQMVSEEIWAPKPNRLRLNPAFTTHTYVALNYLNFRSLIFKWE